MMNPPAPPRLAILLLKWFGLAHDEPFAGDLIEEFHSGRTAGWFWRQTFGAIGAVLRRGVRRPEVRSLLVAYGIVTAAAARFLEIHGPIRASLKPVLIAILVIAAVENVLRRWFKVEQYTGGYLIKKSLMVILNTATLILVGGQGASPLVIIGINVFGLVTDLLPVITRSMPAARTD